MIFDNIGNIKILAIVIFLLLVWNCSPKFSHDVKTFLFDGVPDLYEVEVSAIKDTLSTIDRGYSKINSRVYTSKNEFNLHTPYQKRECSSCHDRNSMGNTKLPTPELCYKCHDSFDKIYEVLHAPVAAGNCSECHNPHKSKLKDLLILPIEDLCLDCHSDSSNLEGLVHKDTESENCTKCHNAHGGSSSFSLKLGSCYECHDNYQKKFEYVHAPVASENCSECHDSHQSKKLNFLKYSNQNLCKSCHDSKEFFFGDYHKKANDENCLDCHDPHGGSNKNFVFN